MKRRRGRQWRTEAEIQSLVAGYETGSGQTRAEYCAAKGLPVTTLDYYRRRLRGIESSLVEIDIRKPGPVVGTAGWAGAAATSSGPVALVLRNGRRVEIGWNDLDRLSGNSQRLRDLCIWLEEA